MAGRIYNYQGANRTEARCIRQIEKSKLLGLLEQERRLTNFLAEHHSSIILGSSSQPKNQTESILASIGNHPQIKETGERIDNILAAYTEFKLFSDDIRRHTQSSAFAKVSAAHKIRHQAV